MKPCPSLSFTGSSTVFCLLQVRLEGPWGYGGIMGGGPKEPWAEEVVATEEVPLREPTGI